jgi:peroxiredoxin
MTNMTDTRILPDLFEQCRDMDGSLNERLAAFAEELRKGYPSFAEAVDRLVDRLAKSGAGRRAPRPGDSMPPFLFPDDAGHLVSLDDFLRTGPLALTFHRGHWCPYCRLSINALTRVHREIARDGGQIAAVVPDRQPFAAEFKARAQGEIPVLIDMDNSYALSLGLAFWVGEEMKRLMLEENYDLAQFHGNDAWFLPIPATFVIGRDGIVKTRFIDPDYRKRMTIEDLLSALRDNL